MNEETEKTKKRLNVEQETDDNVSLEYELGFRDGERRAWKHIKEILNGENVKLIIEKINERVKGFTDNNIEKARLEKDKTEKIITQKIDWLKTKYKYDIFMVCLISVFLAVLTIIAKLDPPTVGTMYGMIIGYSLSRLQPIKADSHKNS